VASGPAGDIRELQRSVRTSLRDNPHSSREPVVSTDDRASSCIETHQRIVLAVSATDLPVDHHPAAPEALASAGAPRLPRLRLLGAALAACAAWVAAIKLLAPLWDWLLGNVVGLDLHSRVGESVRFFFYDSTKIALLLAGIVFAVAVLRSFLSVERTRALLGGRREGVGNAMAAGLGVATPFCSCSAVPAFIGFVSAGVPLGVTLSFLIASPLVNEVAVVLLAGLFGVGVAALYIASGLSIAIVAGVVLGRLRLERYVEPFVFETHLPVCADPAAGLQWSDRFAYARGEVRAILGKVWPYLLAGIALGAVIHGWVPQDALASIAGSHNPLAVPAAVLMGVPLYSNAAGVLPLIEALHAKGVAMGTLLAFMMAVVALSLPEMILLRRVLKVRLIAIWAGVVAVSICLVGFLFNLVL
jgi:uncharacterized membrane protein YraQ (UPF0718 family)